MNRTRITRTLAVWSLIAGLLYLARPVDHAPPSVGGVAWAQGSGPLDVLDRYDVVVKRGNYVYRPQAANTDAARGDALQYVFENVVTAGDEVYIAAKDFAVDAELDILSRMKVHHFGRLYHLHADRNKNFFTVTGTGAAWPTRSASSTPVDTGDKTRGSTGIVRHWVLDGDGICIGTENYGGAWGTECGIAITGSQGWKVSGLTFQGLGGWGVKFGDTSGTASVSDVSNNGHIGGQVSNCYAYKNNGGGFVTDMRGEYCTFNNCYAKGWIGSGTTDSVGFAARAGNTYFVDCHADDCRTGLIIDCDTLLAGVNGLRNNSVWSENPAHGSWTGGSINHSNLYSIRTLYTTATNGGFLFNNLSVFSASSAIGTGTIELSFSDHIAFNNCTLSCPISTPNAGTTGYNFFRSCMVQSADYCYGKFQLAETDATRRRTIWENCVQDAKGYFPDKYHNTTTAQLKTKCVYATTANLSANYNQPGGAGNGVGATLTATGNGAISVDGASPSSSNRILVKDQTTATQNGIYSVTTVGDGSNPFVLTRVTDCDASSEFNQSQVYVTSGTTNGVSSWFYSGSSSPTMGSTNITYDPCIAYDVATNTISTYTADVPINCYRATQTVSTINGADLVGRIIYLRQLGSNQLTVAEGGNIELSADTSWEPDNATQILVLRASGTTWNELYRTSGNTVLNPLYAAPGAP